jgi:hypothetical protein
MASRAFPLMSDGRIGLKLSPRDLFEEYQIQTTGQ